ncbi:maltokinase N-terminal cap-like domain-containing protein [Actinopolymorpha pittospori]
MAVIHKTTLSPTKMELLAPWLPTQPWYVRTEREPELTRVGGFRLDDPQGEVGIEFMVVTDASGDRPVSYHVPVTYRGAPLDGAEQALIGTPEHGVLGQRWVYDGTHDPVLVSQLLAFFQGRAEAQAQSVSNTPDPTVARHFSGAGLSGVAGPSAVASGSYGTDVAVGSTEGGDPAGPWTIRVSRLLRPGQQVPEPGATKARGHVAAGWRGPDGEEHRGVFAVLYDAAP